MKLKNIQSMSRAQIDELSKEELSSTWSYMRRILKSRFKTFIKQGLESAIPKRFRGGVPTVRQLGSAEELAKQIGMAAGYTAGAASTAAGYAEAMQERYQDLEDRLGVPMNAKQFAQYKSFMDEMSARMKETWKHVSAEAEEMYIQSRRLGIGIDQFKKNFDYWAEHIQELSKAKPKKGRKTPSAYIKDLNLEKISSWKRRKK